jgi:hypothetical protein
MFTRLKEKSNVIVSCILLQWFVDRRLQGARTVRGTVQKSVRNANDSGHLTQGALICRIAPTTDLCWLHKLAHPPGHNPTHMTSDPLSKKLVEPGLKILLLLCRMVNPSGWEGEAAWSCDLP